MGCNLSISDYEYLTRCSDGGILVLTDDEELSVLFASKEFCSLVGKKEPVSLFDFLTDTGKFRLKESLISETGDFSIECEVVKANGVLVSTLLKVVHGDSKLYCTLIINNERSNYFRQLRFEQSRFESLIDMSNLILLEIDTLGNIVYRTSAFNSMFKLPCTNIDFKTFILTADFVKNDYIPDIVTLLRYDYTRNEVVTKEIELLVNGEYKWFNLVIRGIVNEHNQLLRILVRFDDINSYKESIGKISTRAYKDDLTGCYKKAYLMEQLANSSLSDKSYLLFFDVDNFKSINDTYGHINGDVALKEIANWAFKIFGDFNSIVCRFGGDEYCVFVNGIENDKIRDKVESFRCGVRSINIASVRPISISIGVAQGHNCNLSTLMNEADLALYATKKKGKNNFSFYSDVKDEETEGN